MQQKHLAVIQFSIKAVWQRSTSLLLRFLQVQPGSHLKIKRPTTLDPRDKACERSDLFVTSLLFLLIYKL